MTIGNWIMIRRAQVTITLSRQLRGLVISGVVFAVGKLGITITWLPSKGKRWIQWNGRGGGVIHDA